MFLSDEFLIQARTNPVRAATDAIDKAFKATIAGETEWTALELDILLETLAFIGTLAESGTLPLAKPSVKLIGVVSEDCAAVYAYLSYASKTLSKLVTQLSLGEQQERMKKLLGTVFSYEFTQGDLERVQVLLNELRALIAKVEGLDEDHRQRILASLEKMQRELHKKVSDFDRFYGFAAQVSSLLHKVGTDAKPIVDRVRELLGIAWETQARGDELPSGTEPPLLPKPDQSNPKIET